MKAFFVAALCTLCTGMFACSAATESEPQQPPADAVGRPPATPETPETPVAAPDDGHARAHLTGAIGLDLPADPLAFVCMKDAFCDDFEGLLKAPIGAGWTNVVRTGGAKMEVSRDSASVGKAALTLYSQGETSAAFLEREKNAVTDKWTGLLGFAMNVDDVPTAQLGGPELAMDGPDGPVSVRIALRPEGLALEQLSAASCGGKRCRPYSTIIAPAKDRSWYRVQISLTVNGGAAAPYGTVEARVDDDPVVVTDLNVPLYAGSVSLRAGITQGDTRPSIVSLDDVTLLVH